MKRTTPASSHPRSSHPPDVSRAPHAIRIIGGQWKRTRIAVADKPGLRPTPDRVRETVFNWLGQDLSGWHCMDVFAGTGALGFEAASRGAAKLTLVEQDGALVAALHALRERLHASEAGVDIRRGDGVGCLRQMAPGSLHLVLIDPPFDSQLWDGALAAAAPALAPGGYVYLEAPRAWTQEDFARHGLSLWRHQKAGAVHAHLARRPREALP